MAMGTAGMAEMGEMEMPMPDNTLPMMTGFGPFGPMEMGGMFSVVKVREGLGPDDYGDPGPYRNPEGTVAHEYNGNCRRAAAAHRNVSTVRRPQNSRWSSREPNHRLRRISTEEEEAEMKTVRTLLFALSLCAVSQAAVAQSSLIDGQVTKVDQLAGKITIKHGPIKKLGMDEGMTMVYKAQDPPCSNRSKPAIK